MRERNTAALIFSGLLALSAPAAAREPVGYTSDTNLMKALVIKLFTSKCEKDGEKCANAITGASKLKHQKEANFIPIPKKKPE